MIIHTDKKNKLLSILRNQSLLLNLLRKERILTIEMPNSVLERRCKNKLLSHKCHLKSNFTKLKNLLLLSLQFWQMHLLMDILQLIHKFLVREIQLLLHILSILMRRNPLEVQEFWWIIHNFQIKWSSALIKDAVRLS